jgi:hypothetical protein
MLINENPFGAYHELVKTKELDEKYMTNLNYLRKIHMNNRKVLTTNDEIELTRAVLTHMNFSGDFIK